MADRGNFGRGPPQQQQVVARPGGERPALKVYANHFPFFIQQKTIYQYAVSFAPETENKTSRFRLVSQIRDFLGMYSFDGTMLFLQQRVEEKDFALQDETGNTVTISLLFTKILEPGDSCELPLQLYNMLFRKILRILKLRQIGRHYFDPSRPVPIPVHNVELWPGYFTAINVMDAGIMLVADVAHKVLRTDTVLDYLYSISQARNMREVATAALIGQVVLTRYNNKTYRVDEIDWDKSPMDKFQRKDGHEMSFLEYYATAYSKSINEKEQPLIVHRHKRKGQQDEVFYLIPELCYLTGISDAMRRDFSVMRDVAVHTRVPPSQRCEQVREFISTINDVPEVKTELDQWDMGISTKMLAVNAKNYGGETVTFGGNRSVTVDVRRAEWTNDLKNNQLVKAVPLTMWMLVFVGQHQQDAKNFLHNIMNVGKDVGMRIDQPKVVELPDDRIPTYVDNIKRWLIPGVQCVVCLLPNNRKDRYDALKILLTLDFPVASQCVVQKSINKPKILKSVCNKIALQMNCKMGGSLWSVNIPLKRCMVMGIDIGPKASAGGKSVVAFCASMNSEYTKFETRAVIQRAGQELVAGLQTAFAEMIRKWFENNKSLPQYIIVYRDGVGEGMIPAVMDHEIPQFKEVFKGFGDNYDPRLAVIIVKKRVHTRLFEMNGNTMQNPTPGTVVDNGCTTKLVNGGQYNFFLVSQHVNEGTVTPAHYVVLEDNTGLQKEHIQALTYKLTHMYYNWPGTIRVPAVCQYAHKLAYFIGQTLHREPDPKLADRLYFL